MSLGEANDKNTRCLQCRNLIDEINKPYKQDLESLKSESIVEVGYLEVKTTVFA